MSWVAQRRFRISVVAIAFVLALLFIVMTFTGIQLLHDYDARAATCSARMDCVWVQRFFSTFRILGHVWSVVLLVAPAIAGAGWGAMLARDLEGADVASPQTTRVRRRWIVRRFVAVTTVVLALLALLSWAVSWWESPLDRFYHDPFNSFGVRDIVPVAYAAFAIVLGAAAGLFLRRRAMALATTLAIFAAVRVLIEKWMRPNVFPRVTASAAFHAPGLGGGPSTRLHVERGAWVFDDRVVTMSGRSVTRSFGVGPHGRLFGMRIQKGTATIPGVGRCSGRIPGASSQVPWHPGPEARLALRHCVDGFHLRELVTYLPSSRYWPLQGVEAVVFLVLAIAIGAFCVRRATRRDDPPDPPTA